MLRSSILRERKTESYFHKVMDSKIRFYPDREF